MLTTSTLRNRLADKLVADGVMKTRAIEDAFRALPRELFVPDATLESAYADDAVYTKQDDGGVFISAASKPSIVAEILEQLQPQPGELIVEAGAGTGINAALIGLMVGPTGHVTTLDVDADLVDGAAGT
ncbi:hypothetical protein AB0M47_39220 [Hamadaea sp. NPDC051192]|uniref:hypothetical protein n=1 Tax=Hamadaea sp. NPDC051192 TaxID=3154940 RepID=UPI0034302699